MIADFPKTYRDALAYWCAFRNLGFDADEIYFGFGVVSGNSDVVYLQLQTQKKFFTVTVGQIPGAKEADVHKTWMKLADQVHVSDVSERQACFKEHLLGTNFEYYAMFAASIRSKGIIIPELAELSPNKA